MQCLPLVKVAVAANLAPTKEKLRQRRSLKSGTRGAEGQSVDEHADSDAPPVANAIRDHALAGGGVADKRVRKPASASVPGGCITRVRRR